MPQIHGLLHPLMQTHCQNVFISPIDVSSQLPITASLTNLFVYLRLFVEIKGRMKKRKSQNNKSYLFPQNDVSSSRSKDEIIEIIFGHKNI